MRIAVTGSSGLLGTAVVASLRADGNDVVRLVRRSPTSSAELHFDPARGVLLPTAALDGVDAVVNLAGAGAADHRWTRRYRETIVRSRVVTTQALADAIAGALPRPRVFLSASAVGYYGETTAPVDETAQPGDGFLARTCVRWEAATSAAEQAGVRVVHLRSGVVLSRSGGALAKVLPLFRFGLGGRLGSGRQHMSWISLADHVTAMRFLLDAADVAGPVNLTSPQPVTNREYTRAIAVALRRLAPWIVPGPALHLVIGGFASEVLGSRWALPRRLTEAGFAFSHPSIEQGIAAALR